MDVVCAQVLARVVQEQPLQRARQSQSERESAFLMDPSVHSAARRTRSTFHSTGVAILRRPGGGSRCGQPCMQIPQYFWPTILEASFRIISCVS